MVASAFCPLNSGGPERERGDLGAHGGREGFRGLGRKSGILGARGGRKESWGSGRKRGILGDQKGRVEDPVSPWPVTVLVAALDLASANFTAQCVGRGIFCVWEKVCVYIHILCDL